MNLLSCREAIDIPRLLLEGLLSDRQDEILKRVDEEYKDKLVDLFRDFFQEEQADRKSLKQDYTPDGISELVSRLAPAGNSLLDVCAGTGALTVSYLARHETDFVRCEEFSSRVIPFLMLNLALRNQESEVVHKDVLTGEIFGIYQIKKGEEYGVIIEKEQVEERMFDVVIMNPPYGMSWNPTQNDVRFNDFGIAPKANSDYAFLLHGFHFLKEKGKLFAIMAQGILFRDKAEKEIRKNLALNGYINKIVTLPEKLFLATSIPVVIVELNKTRNEDVYFLDASDDVQVRPKQNIMLPEHIEKIVTLAKNRLVVKKKSELVAIEDIKENDWTLQNNVYIDTYESPVIPKSEDVMDKLLTAISETRKAEDEFLQFFKKDLDNFVKLTKEEYPSRLDVTEKRLQPIQEQLELW